MKFGSRDRDRNDEQFRKLFIGGLNAQTDDAKLRTFYEQWGELTDCVVMKDKTSGRSRGFGFVTYKDFDSVERAMAARPHTIDEKVVEAKRAAPRESNNDPRTQATVKKMFIGGYKDDISEEDLRTYFGQYGEIKEVSILSDNGNKKRGFCFVTFEDYDPVDKACLERYHTINGHRLEAQKALTREQMAEIRNKQSGGGQGGYQQGPPQGGPGYGPYSQYPGWQGNGGYYGGYGQPPYGGAYPPGNYPPPHGGWAPPPPSGPYPGGPGAAGYGQPGQQMGYGGYQGGYGQQGGYGGQQQGGYGGQPPPQGGEQGGQFGGPGFEGGPVKGEQAPAQAGGPGPGPMRGGTFTSRAGPYGGGYGSSGRR